MVKVQVQPCRLDAFSSTKSSANYTVVILHKFCDKITVHCIMENLKVITF